MQKSNLKNQNDNLKCKIAKALPALLLIVIFALIAAKIITGKNTVGIDVLAIPEVLTHSASPTEKRFYEDAFVFARDKIPADGVVAGIIPHHLLAADLIAKFFTGLEGEIYDTVVLVGPNHFSAGQGDVISSAALWQTPYGALEPDRDLLGSLAANNLITVDEEAIANEHAITSEAAFIKRTFPDSKFLPLMIRSGVTAETASVLGHELRVSTKNKKILVLASVDFSHYQDSATAQADDKESISAIESGDPALVYRAALDSPASITAVMAYAQAAGAKFKLKENSNSAILLDQPELKETTSYVTGYFTR